MIRPPSGVLLLLFGLSFALKSHFLRNLNQYFVGSLISGKTLYGFPESIFRRFTDFRENPLWFQFLWISDNSVLCFDPSSDCLLLYLINVVYGYDSIIILYSIPL